MDSDQRTACSTSGTSSTRRQPLRRCGLRGRVESARWSRQEDRMDRHIRPAHASGPGLGRLRPRDCRCTCTAHARQSLADHGKKTAWTGTYDPPTPLGLGRLRSRDRRCTRTRPSTPYHGQPRARGTWTRYASPVNDHTSGSSLVPAPARARIRRRSPRSAGMMRQHPGQAACTSGRASIRRRSPKIRRPHGPQ